MPVRLDNCIFSANTATMDGADLTTYGLEATDSAVSDHLMVGADFR